MEKIVCSAIHYDNNQEYIKQPINIKRGLVIAGLRHENCTVTKLQTDIHFLCPHTKGFITNTNRFVDEHEAFAIALKAKQIKTGETKMNYSLSSDDLY